MTRRGKMQRVLMLVGLYLMLLMGSATAGTISVMGTATLEQIPDQVLVRLQVVKTATTATQAKSAADESVTAILDSVRGLGLADNQIDAADLRLSPRYDYQNRVRTYIGIEASRQIVLILKDPTLLAPLLDKVVSAGADEVQGVNWHFSQLKSLQHQARIAALKDARKQAQELAAVYGAKLGEVERIDTVNQASPMPRLRMAMADESAGYQAPTQQISVQVWVEFELD
ncbi:DUF541 domain-containing protein [Corallincola spongiicola]|uniref:DUF541 domain-containing protein n=2 Tax=Corallincola spongiicola TaxID=2520508 RepID=A0ABY1WP52_9GAMM|nr:DUF541 domain-containing protein [Corallincola spongiicola]